MGNGLVGAVSVLGEGVASFSDTVHTWCANPNGRSVKHHTTTMTHTAVNSCTTDHGMASLYHRPNSPSILSIGVLFILSS